MIQETIPGILLAAGASRRFGAPKLLMLVGDRPAIYHSLRAALEAPLDPLYVVVGCEHEKVLSALDELRAHTKLQVLYNAEWKSGRASSLRLALASLCVTAPGAVVLLGDMPLMTSHLIARVVKAFLSGERLCFPIYQGSVGRPVALPKELLPEFIRLQGDRSGLHILKDRWEEATKLELSTDEEATQLDLDTPGDWETIQRVRFRSDWPVAPTDS